MPRPKKLTRPFFVRRFSATTAGGESILAEIRVCLPKRVSRGEYRSDCEVICADHRTTFSIPGVDGVQSTLLALTLLGMEVEGRARVNGWKIPRWELADLIRLRPRAQRVLKPRRRDAPNER